MPAISAKTVKSHSTFLEHLPAIFQEDIFAGQFLLAFEKILLGRDDGVHFPYSGLEEIISDIVSLFDPKETPIEFLSWLADWTAFSLRADLNEDQQRDFVSKIIQLYRHRGTKRNLQDLLSIFTVGTPIITEAEAGEFQIGERSTIGENTYLGGEPSHFFHVTISLPEGLEKRPQELDRQLEIANALIELGKPAHTHYRLEPIFPSMQVGISSSVGIDTLLGTVPKA